MQYISRNLTMIGADDKRIALPFALIIDVIFKRVVALNGSENSVPNLDMDKE